MKEFPTSEYPALDGAEELIVCDASGYFVAPEPPTSTLIDGFNKCQLSGDVKEVNSALTCIYFTPLVEVVIGLDRIGMFVHRGVLSQSSVLESKCKDRSNNGKIIITISEVDLELFSLIATYLYKGDYRNSSSPIALSPWTEYSDIEKFHKHMQLYSFSCNYKLERLCELVVSNIEASSRPDFQSLLEIAKEAYGSLLEDDIWFVEYFKSAARNALGENPSLPDQTWILDTIRCGGKLAVHLFTTLVQTDSLKTGVGRPQEHPAHIPPQPETSACPERAQHLVKLGKKGLWKTCQTCTRDRDRILSLGTTIILLVFSSVHTFHFDASIGSEDLAEPSGNITVDAKRQKKARKKHRKRMLAACNKPHIALLASILCEEALQEDWVNFCPDQSNHLKKMGDKWLWEDCTLCLQDRRRTLEKIRQLASPEELTSLEVFKQTGSQQNSDYAVEAMPQETTFEPQIDQSREVSNEAVPERTSSTVTSKVRENKGYFPITCNHGEEPNLEFPYVEDQECYYGSL